MQIYNDEIFNNAKIRHTFTLPSGLKDAPFSLAGSLSYNSESQSIIFSDGLSWKNVGITNPGSAFIFYPDYTGPERSGTFTDWKKLMAAMMLTPGVKFLLLVDDAVSPVVIPPGIWDMTNIVIFSPVSRFNAGLNFVQVLISDGAVLNNLSAIQGPYNIVYAGTTQPCITFSTTSFSDRSALVFGRGARFSCSGTQPFIYIDLPGSVFEIVLDLGGGIGSGTTQAINVAAGSTLFIGLASFSAVDNNSIAGQGTVLFGRGSLSGSISIPLNQPAITGFKLIQDIYLQVPLKYDNSGAPGVNNDNTQGFKTGDIWIDTAADDVYIAANVNTGAAVWRGPV
jgi:hypothetical protein